ncbi:acyl-CoA dehydrogenase [Aeromicrobium sp. PE09-221]|uniref:acyl-CoA dehydrogenase family protein n=1 Tax=Actinomycetes TaxID=1760 RepID=UPI000B3EBBB7|nr:MULTISPECIES: acyl-CoA dehydrogenase family protein [Actinomycetes]MCT2139259.1 acyl-CoA dehydrogenase family protein [Dietzia cinnamea]OUZ10257.1 acyl-CoA dehydrogenase [Aeromicrobium sp. PE09-221]
MRLQLTDEQEAFRDRMRSFFSIAVPQEIRDKVAAGAELSREEIVSSQQILNAHGLAVPQWPVAWGGQDWTPVERHLWTDELQRSATPMPLVFNTSLVGPVIAEFGTEEQKQRFLPATANLDIWWCQGFSEPEAGSDLASLRTRAVREDDHYIVNGQKTWTTYAHYADWMFALVRTDPDAPRKQQGISFLLIDMTSPGVTVRPIELLDGAKEVNEVFLDDVRVPAENLIGEDNQGWACAKFLLGNERGGFAMSQVVRRRLAQAKQAAAEIPCGGGNLLDDQLFRARIAELETTAQALEVTGLRVVAGSQSGRPNPISSLLKLRGSQLHQDTTQLLLDVAGPDARLFEPGSTSAPDWAPRTARTYLNNRKSTIYGGSSEVQRSIIASSILGL